MYKYINCNGETLINCDEIIAYDIEEEYEGAETLEVCARSHGVAYTLGSGYDLKQARAIIGIIQDFLLSGGYCLLEIEGNTFTSKRIKEI